MILSHKHQFIFIKTNKTAGTSIEIALSKFCGPDDIIARISSRDEKTRRQLGYPGPQHHLAPLREYSPRDLVTALFKAKRKQKFYNHMSAAEIKRYVGDDTWNRYYKFCFERNPWDRVVSLYYFVHKTEPRPSISDFIVSGAPLILKHRGYDLYTLDGQVAVDRVCRFEQLAEEMETVRQEIGLPTPLELPHAKSGYRRDKRPYSELLNEQDRQAIAEMFAEEIQLLGYQ